MRNLKEINVVQEITFRSLVFGFFPAAFFFFHFSVKDNILRAADAQNV